MAKVYRIREVDQTFTDITDYFRHYEMELTMNAEEASVGTSSIRAYDPNGDFTYAGHRLFRMQETVAGGSNTYIYAGYTAEREWSRGDFERTGVGRVVDISLTDLNTILDRRIYRSASANRPAETDVARMQWLVGSPEVSFAITDSRYLSTSNGVAMDAVDYRDQKPADVVNDCVQASGKNAFVWYAGDDAVPSLFYDFASATVYSSPLRLSNVESDIDDTWTFAISADTKLQRDPSRVYSGVLVPYDGGRVYESDVDTANTFAIGGRDAIMPNYNVKSVAKATARAVRYLSDASTEEDTITTTVLLPAAKVNFLMQGMRVQFKATHLPGFEDWVWVRALNRTVRDRTEEYYAVTLDLTLPDQPATVTPAPGGTGHIVLYQPTNEHTGDYNRSVDVVFDTSGDDPPSGYPSDPTTGNFTTTTYTSGGNTYYAAVKCTAAGTVTVTFHGTFAEVYNAGASGGFKLMQNGVTIDSQLDTTLTGGYWSPSFDLSATVTVANNDLLAVQYTGDLTVSGRYPKVPAGSGSVSNKLTADFA